MQIRRRKTEDLATELDGIHPILKKIFVARGIRSKEDLDIALSGLQGFVSLKDIDKACERLARALQNEERILIVGDFDADGATSSALAVSALKDFGASHVEFLVPNRFEFGYGLSPEIVMLAKKWRPDVIITVDNGIASLEGVEAANQLGIDVIVTDHHLPGDNLPKAYAIVNPNQRGCPFPSKSIAGVGVIFYVMAALRRTLLNQNWFEKKKIPTPKMTRYLDLVALGTVADVVSLDKNNRTLVLQGLKQIQKGQCRYGIKALAEIANRKIESIRESDLGFALAPRLNAAGRLDDMALGIECLLAGSRAEANSLAKQLDDLNKERRQIEQTMKEQAYQALNKLDLSNNSEQSASLGLCLYDKSWHQGVIGILAGRLKETYHCPVIAFAYINDHELKGSARSISKVNIRDVLASIDKDNPGVIQKFGGHAMAAGLSIHPEKFNDFKQAFYKALGNEMTADDCEQVILSDGELAQHDLTLDFAELIQSSGPWGQNFAEPLFDNRFEILEQRIVGERHLKLSLRLESGGPVLDAIAFNVNLEAWPNHRAIKAHVAYRLDVNEFANRKRLQLMVEGITLADDCN